MKVTESAMSAIKALDTPVTLPTSGAMVIEAVERLGGGGRGGLSLQSIKKYIAENHVVVNQSKQNALTRKAIQKLVNEGKLVRIKGTGASGRFKLAAAATKKPAIAEKKKPANPVVKIKINGGRIPEPVKSTVKPLPRKSNATKKAESSSANAEKKTKKEVPTRSTDQKADGSSEATSSSKPTVKKEVPTRSTNQKAELSSRKTSKRKLTTEKQSSNKK